jgi:hypothetical protein
MNSAPPKIHSSAAPFWVAVAVLAAAGFGVATVIYFFNPATHGFYPVCQFHRLTGLNCPGCGMTRAFYALLHGDIRTALHDNALFVAGLGWLTVRGVWFGVNKRRGRQNGDFIPARYLWLLAVAALGFTVLRNLPAFAFLSP